MTFFLSIGLLGIAFDNGGAPFVPGTYADIILSGYDDVKRVGYVEVRNEFIKQHFNN